MTQSEPAIQAGPLTGQHIVVLGAGIAGLAAAIALRLRGASVDVLEQAPEITEVGAGLQISPNGMRVIHALGLRASGIGHPSQAVELRDKSGRLVTRLNLPQPGAPDGGQPGFFLCHRADLISALEARARALGVQVQLLQKVVSVRPDTQGVELKTSVGATHHAAFVIGADGLHSVLRPILNGPREPFFTGQVAWRATIPGDDGPPIAQVFMGPGRHLVSYPLRGGRLRNIVAVQERRQWAAEGWSHPDDPDTLRDVFGGFGGPVPAWLERLDQVWLWGLFRHPIAETWHDPSGRCVLIGDAAHPTLPFMAQGANLALEDALEVASALAQPPNNAAVALQSFAAKRIPRVTAIVKAANANARNYHLRGPLAPIAHQVLRIGSTLAPSAALKRFAWIYDHDVTKG